MDSPILLSNLLFTLCTKYTKYARNVASQHSKKEVWIVQNGLNNKTYIHTQKYIYVLFCITDETKDVQWLVAHFRMLSVFQITEYQW